MKLPVIYVAGPYRSQTREGVEMNIQAARHVAALCCRKGWSVICQHSNTGHLDAIVPHLCDQFWLDTTMELLRRCDAVVLVPGWQNSTGTLAEIEEAQRLGMHVYYGENELPTANEFNGMPVDPARARPRFEDHPDAKCFVQNPSGTWWKNTLTDNVRPDDEWEAWFSDVEKPDGWVELHEGPVLGDWKQTLVKRPPSGEKSKCQKCNGVGHYPSVLSPGLRQPPNIPCEQCKGSTFEPLVSIEDGGDYKQQRDELLAALEELAELHYPAANYSDETLAHELAMGSPSYAAAIKARAAITKAKGGAA